MNVCKKKNPASFYGKNSQQSGTRGNIPQCNKHYIRQTHRQHCNQWAKTIIS